MVGVAGRSKGCGTCKSRKIGVSPEPDVHILLSTDQSASVGFNGQCAHSASSPTDFVPDTKGNQCFWSTKICELPMVPQNDQTMATTCRLRAGRFAITAAKPLRSLGNLRSSPIWSSYRYGSRKHSALSMHTDSESLTTSFVRGCRWTTMGRTCGSDSSSLFHIIALH